MNKDSSLIILGIDPGTLATGYALIEKKASRLTAVASGVISTHASDTLPIRLGKIYDQIFAVINEYHPDHCAIETAFYGKNIQSTLKLGHARGVSILAAVHREIPVTEYSPREIKRSVTGSGAASKQQVQYMVHSILGLKQKISRLDISDAFAIALCHAQHLSSPRAKFRDWTTFIKENPDRIKQGR